MAGAESVHAQAVGTTTRSTVSEASRSIARRAQAGVARLDGVQVGENTVLSSTVSAGGGYDSNVDRIFDGEGSHFGGAGIAASLTTIEENQSFQLRGSIDGLAYDDLDFREERSDASVSADYTRTLMPGVVAKAGGVFSLEGDQFIKEETSGVYGEVAVSTPTHFAFVRGAGLQARYLTQPGIPSNIPVTFQPLFFSSAFNVVRADLTAGALLYPSAWLSPYVEVQHSNLDYFNQPLANVIDRTASDQYRKVGLRIRPSKTLQMDVGARWNKRKTSAQDLDTSDFDASLSWSPTQAFSLGITYDRYIDEPTTLLSLMSDVKALRVNVAWAPTDDTSISVAASRETNRAIGDVFDFTSREISGEFAYRFMPAATAYFGGQYEFLEEDVTDETYDRVVFTAGVRYNLTHQDKALTGGGLKDGATIAQRTFRGPRGATLGIGVGYSTMDLPETRMTTLVSGPFVDEATGQLVDHDGEFEGPRVDLELNDFAQWTGPRGLGLSFMAGAYYANFDDTQVNRCEFEQNPKTLTVNQDCRYVNIDDFSANEENNTDLFGKFETTVGRIVHSWGVSVGSQLFRQTLGSMKDDYVENTPTPFIFGLDVRGLNQDLELTAIDLNVPDPVKYTEELDTYYYGGFAGLRHKFAVTDGLSIGVDGRAGLYYAHTDYEGRYLAFVPVDGGRFIFERGAVDLARNETAFIGTAHVNVDYTVGNFSAGAYAKGEYYSYVPKVLYNNNDEAGGSPFGIRGTQVGTELGEDDSFVGTVGGRVSVKF